MPWGTSSWLSLELVVMVEQSMKAVNFPNITVGKLHPYMVSVFPNGNRFFNRNNIQCRRTRNVLERFQKRNTEFHLRFRLSNLECRETAAQNSKRTLSGYSGFA